MQYYLKDHLGNVRAVMDENGTIIQETEYYAFGLPIQRSGSDKNKYLYNGKEKQPQTEWLDYGARMYDPTIGRWMVVDPLAEGSPNTNPYTYCFNDPISYIDVIGLHPDSAANYAPGAIVNNPTGTWQYLGAGKWVTVWEATENNPSSPNTTYIESQKDNPLSGYYKNLREEYPSDVDRRNNLIGAVTASAQMVASNLRDGLNSLRYKGQFTREYWIAVKKYGGVMRYSNVLSKIADSKILGVGSLAISGAIFMNKVRNGQDKASDVASLALSAGLLAISVSNPIVLTGLAVYAIGEYTGFNDQVKAAFDARFDKDYQDFKAGIRR